MTSHDDWSQFPAHNNANLFTADSPGVSGDGGSLLQSDVYMSPSIDQSFFSSQWDTSISLEGRAGWDTLAPSPAFLLSESTSSENPFHTRLNELRSMYVPQHPVQPTKNCENVKIHLRMLHCDTAQLSAIEAVYKQDQFFHKVFEPNETAQTIARFILENQGLDINRLDDLGNGWSIRWSKDNNYGRKSSISNPSRRLLLQCQCGSSTSARQLKQNTKRAAQNKSYSEDEWTRKMPFDFTGCLAHLDITFQPDKSIISRIAGILAHNEGCRSAVMKRLPAVPLHLHVWQIALEQLNNGASLAAIQERNRALLRAKMYHGQQDYNPKTANIRYNFLPTDTSRLYRKQASLTGINLLEKAKHNVDNWLNSTERENSGYESVDDVSDTNEDLATDTLDYQGLCLQGNIHLEHGLTTVLSHLHGLSALLGDASNFKLSSKSRGQLSELVDIISQVQSSCKSLLGSSDSRLALEEEHPVLQKKVGGAVAVSTILTRPTLLPPSPECSQKRKKSYGTI